MSQSRSAAHGIATLFFLLVPAHAQDLAGRWTGRMEPENLSAEIELDLARTDTSWRAAP